MLYNKIPNELKKLDRWVCWRWEDRNGTPAKVPINPTGNEAKRAMSSNPSTWGTFEDAVDGVERLSRFGVQGIGFVFNGDGVVGVDVDHCISAEGELNSVAYDIITTLNSYTEYSQSGHGVHIICTGKLPEGYRREGDVEMYETGRFFIMTGNAVNENSDIEDRFEELAVVHHKYIASKKKKVEHKSSPASFESISLSDRDIIEKACNAKNGQRFRALYGGDVSGNGGDDSAADIAFCNMLAFWTGRNADQMDSIFRSSGLMRSKWTETRPGGTYGSHTIAKAIADCREVYSPRTHENKDHGQREQPPEPDTGIDYLVVKDEKKANYDTTSDLGRSKYFSDRYKNQLYYCAENKSWLIWDGKRWQGDRMLQVVQHAKTVVEELIKAAGELVQKAQGEDAVKKAKQIYKDTVKARSERSIKAMIELAKSDLPVTVDRLDEDPYLLNCQNGVVDLRTGELHPHDPELLITKMAAANYVPNKPFKMFGEFMRDICLGDGDLATYFQQICGMAAIGKVFFEGMCIFYGFGRNGKSTFLNLISKVFGDYACSINPEVLMNQRDGKQLIGSISVEGKRFVTALETEEGKRLSAAMLKRLASTDPITERPMYAAERTFLPTHTLMMASNFLPKVSSTDDGTWRRIMVVPFKAKFEQSKTKEGKKDIKGYANVIYKEDADAILSWIVEGAKMYIANGYNITPPEVVREATDQYKAAEDWLGNFIQDCCETGEYEESGGTLLEVYKEWCAANNESYVRRSNDFAAALQLKGFEKKRTKHGSVWKGLRLLENAEAKSFSKFKSDKQKQGGFLDDDGLDILTRSQM